jgi:hypothetical protein
MDRGKGKERLPLGSSSGGFDSPTSFQRQTRVGPTLALSAPPDGAMRLQHAPSPLPASPLSPSTSSSSSSSSSSAALASSGDGQAQADVGGRPGCADLEERLGAGAAAQRKAAAGCEALVTFPADDLALDRAPRVRRTLRSPLDAHVPPRPRHNLFLFLFFYLKLNLFYLLPVEK